jgi:hypothetical protein
MGVCEYCGDYWQCGPDADCGGPGQYLEDRCHTIRILGRKRGKNCLQAKVWLPGWPIPPGWKKWADVPVRVSTFRDGEGNPRVRVWVDKCDPTLQTVCGPSDITVAIPFPGDMADASKAERNKPAHSDYHWHYDESETQYEVPKEYVEKAQKKDKRKRKD